MNKEEIDNLLLLLFNDNLTDCGKRKLKNCIEDLQHQLEEKQKAIDEAIEYIKNNLTISSILDGKKTYCLNSYTFDYEELLKILIGDKNE